MASLKSIAGAGTFVALWAGAGAVAAQDLYDSMMAMGANAEPKNDEPIASGVTLYHRCDNLSELPS